jgi:hypothetical protein
MTEVLIWLVFVETEGKPTNIPANKHYLAEINYMITSLAYLLHITAEYITGDVNS